MSSLTHKYIPRVSEREDNVFLEEYYSGSDTKIFINGEQQKEISYIQYTVSEQLKPIYGYNSRTFDAIAVGNRIVTGAFKMPIKNPEEQAKRQDVISDYIKTTEDTINVCNQEQEKLKSDKEWTSNLVIKDDKYANDEVYKAQTKLNLLGYELKENGIMDTDTLNAIRNFQEENKCAVTGTLTTETIIALDKKIEILDKEIFNVQEDNTPVYAGPTSSSLIIGYLSKNDQFYLLSKDFTGFIMIRTSTGIDGFLISD